MPELVPIYEQLVALAGGDPLVARFLPLYNPTPYLTGCSQVVWHREGRPLLLRNYDYAPHLWEAVLLRSAWNGTAVLAMNDCLWGALDGVNAHGLAGALAFGGRRVVGDGFGIPLVLRYLLETCASVREAIAALTRIPSRMAYNVTLVDASGDFVSAHLAPDHPPTFERHPIATNHQPIRDWPEYTRISATLERAHYLEAKLAEPGLDREGLAAAFLEPPLHSTRYANGFGTLYTAIYDPLAGSVELRWPGQRVEQRLDAFEPGELELQFDVAAPALAAGAGATG
jgi:predicted choloylglycine hydrolase